MPSGMTTASSPWDWRWEEAEAGSATGLPAKGEVERWGWADTVANVARVRVGARAMGDCRPCMLAWFTVLKDPIRAKAPPSGWEPWANASSASDRWVLSSATSGAGALRALGDMPPTDCVAFSMRSICTALATSSGVTPEIAGAGSAAAKGRREDPGRIEAALLTRGRPDMSR